MPTIELSAAAKAALAQFVANGGKLIIHDSDETTGNDYSWLLPGPYSSRIGASCTNCGLTSGTSKITQDSALMSANPADTSYVNLAELAKYTDALGDANLFVSDVPGGSRLQSVRTGKTRPALSSHTRPTTASSSTTASTPT